MKIFFMRVSMAALLAAATLSAPAFASSDAREQGYRLIQTAAPAPKQIEDAIRANNWAGAESMLNEVLVEKPDSAKAWYWMAQTQEKLNHPSKAFSALSKAEQLQPNLAFASPGAVANMRTRLQQASSAQVRPIQRPAIQTQPLPGYAGRAAVGDTNVNSPALSAPVKESSHTWIYVLLLLAVVGGAGTWYYINQRSKRQAIDAKERDRKALLGRANGAQERAMALSKTARFESQESSQFGVASAGVLSRANSALSRLKSSNATFDTDRERSILDTVEADLEGLENQGARKAWDDAPAASRSATSSGYDAGSTSQGYASSSNPSGQPQSYNSGYASAPAQQAPQTVIVNQGSSGSGFLETMLVANMLNHGGHDRSRENDLERDNQRLRDQQRNDQSRPAAAEPSRDSSSFDLGSNNSSWDSGSSSSSSSSSWDSGSSSSDSGSSSSDSDSGSSDSW